MKHVIILVMGMILAASIILDSPSFPTVKADDCQVSALDVNYSILADFAQTVEHYSTEVGYIPSYGYWVVDDVGKIKPGSTILFTSIQTKPDSATLTCNYRLAEFIRDNHYNINDHG